MNPTLRNRPCVNGDTNEKRGHPRANDRLKSTHGIALVLVLAFLVLITALVLAFFTSVTTELTGAKSYANGANTKQLSDSTVQAVMGAIKQATSGGTVMAWASQPGMIRTYDSSGSSAACYKLYSSDKMILTSSNGQLPFDPTTDYDSSWQSKPALYTDLNSPVTSGTSVLFPIIDGNTIKSLTVSGSNVYTYSSSGSTADVEGFSIDPTVITNYVPGNPLSGTNTPVPMPTKWIYVLKDGTLTTPTGVDGTGKIANWTGSGSSTTPTTANPIVGRIAFWTDDETCKVNINTASEGDYWDTPRTTSTYDRTNLAQYQPAQNEFQRYPGHPATTSLSTVFGSILPVIHTSATNTYSQFQPYYDMASRLNIDQAGNRGSQAGTAQPITGSGASKAGTGALSLKSDRLYASIDELLFQPNGEPRSGSLNPPTGTQLSGTMLEKAKFFITASSRAPDVNLFNQPRIGIWPINANTGLYRSVFDQAIAFCGTINNFPYYFQRQNSFDPTNDLPLAGATSGLGRNRMLIQYLQNLTQTAVPGFGGDFVTKYTKGERDQILTEIFDYVRCQDLLDPLLSASNQFAIASPYASTYLPSSFPGTFTSGEGSGQVVPIFDSLGDSGVGTRGFGRFPTVTEADLVFIVTGWNDNSNGSPIPTDPNNTGTNSATNLPWGYYGKPTVTGTAWKFVNGVNAPAAIPANHVRVQAALVFSLFDPSQGMPAEQGCYQIQVQNLDQFQMNGATMNFPAQAKALSNWPSTAFGYNQQKWGGVIDFRTLISAMSPQTGAGQGPPYYKYYPFFSDSIDLPYDPASAGSPTVNPPAFNFTGSTITVNMCIPTSNKWTPGTQVQSIKLKFPNGVFPTPLYAGAINDSGFKDRGRWDIRFSQGANPWSPQSTFIQPQDVVRGVRVATDARLIAATQNLDGTTTGSSAYFTSYTGSETVNAIHSLTASPGYPIYGAIWGQLVPGVSYYSGTGGNPWTGSALSTVLGAANCSGTGAYLSSAAPNTLGDWDNGVSVEPDGPYINKADEGDFHFYDASTSSNTIPYYDTWYSHSVITNAGQTFFSPNRLMPSAVMFGSLSTGVKRNRPWQTLEFKPDPTGNHPGVAAPKDHLLLDLFTMPVVEPYPITEPLSTAGRINMNFQIAPFTYITRSTGVRAVLKSERMTVIPDSDAAVYKKVDNGTQVYYSADNYRVPINVDETIKAFSSYFTSNTDIFRSASQICDIALVPSQDANGTVVPLPFDYTTFWSTHRITGDNTRERPYATIYPRLTTKSNTYTVHMRVQSLKKSNVTGAATWVEGSDTVLSEYRGSQTIERYVDPGDALPDFADPANQTTALDAFYKFRVVSSKQFAP
ncbi:MAG: Verru_Chthon cassette protein A [Chthoniobacteraceae bacterium]